MLVKDFPDEPFIGRREWLDLLLSKELVSYKECIHNLNNIHQKTFGIIWIALILCFGICLMIGLNDIFLPESIQHIYINSMIINFLGILVSLFLCCWVIMPNAVMRIAYSQTYTTDSNYWQLPIEKFIYQITVDYEAINRHNYDIYRKKGKLLMLSIKVMAINIVYFMLLLISYIFLI